MLKVVHSYSHILQSSVSEDKSIIKSAQRVLQIFEFFADVRRPANASEIAAALSFPQSSTSMLLRSLVSLGYLDYHREVRTFEPTIRLSLLGGWVPERIEVARHIIDLLNRLHEETGETVLLAEQSRTLVRCIYVVQKPVAGVSYYIRPGTLRPVCATAAGRMLLTLNAEEEVEAIIKRTNAEGLVQTGWIKRGEFMQILDGCRREGYCVTERVMEDRIGVQCAVLLPAEASGRRLAVAVISEMGRYRATAGHIRERLMAIGAPGAEQSSAA